MTRDFGLGARFPTTHASALVGVRSADHDERTRSFEALVQAYWKPLYKYVRIRWNKSSEDAQDLTQGFFLRAIEKEFFAPYDPARGRFRTYLRTCLDGYLANEHKAARRLKRAGDVVLLPIEFETADGELKRRAPFDSRQSLRRLEEVDSLRGMELLWRKVKAPAVKAWI